MLKTNCVYNSKNFDISDIFIFRDAKKHRYHKKVLLYIILLSMIIEKYNSSKKELFMKSKVLPQ